MGLLENEPLLDVDQIQGNILRGFDTQWLQLIALKSKPEAQLRNWLGNLAPTIASLRQVHKYRLERSAGTLEDKKTVLLNVAVSANTLGLLGYNASDIGEGFLNLPMGSLATSLGDSQEDVAKFALGRDKNTTPDVLLLVGCNDKDALSDKVGQLIDTALAAGLVIIYSELGEKLPNDIEHFGFKDGISQVGVRGLLSLDPVEPLTLRKVASTDPNADYFASPGQPLVWPGQFVFGYPSQQEDSLAPGPVSGGADWLRNGSLIAFRRLLQDVKAFNEFVEAEAKNMNLTAGQFAAKIVGRWPDGTPTLLSSDTPDTSLSSDPMKVNHFAYGGIAPLTIVDNGHEQRVNGNEEDKAGLKCPHLAHIRKVNPRNLITDQGGAGRTLMMQMIRRAIPFGPLYDPAETNHTERGLLFLSYQASFNEQFKKLNAQWMNNPDAPEGGQQNHDLLVGQATTNNGRIGNLPGKPTINTKAKWVIPSGGAFMFSPSVNFFSQLA